MMMMSYGWIGLIVFVLLIYLLISMFDEKSIMNSKKSACQILDERFAKGEISEEEYLKMKRLITKKS